MWVVFDESCAFAVESSVEKLAADKETSLDDAEAVAY